MPTLGPLAIEWLATGTLVTILGSLIKFAGWTWLLAGYSESTSPVPDDPRRRGVRWEDIDLEDGSMDVYRKKQQWDAVSLPDPVISPLRSYQKLMDPPTERWPVFPTLDQRTLAELVQEKLADRGARPAVIDERREEYARDLLLALDEDIRPLSITTDGARSILQRLTEAAEIDIDVRT